MKFDLPLETELQEFKTSLSELDKGIESITAMLNKGCKQASISAFPIMERW